MWRESNDIFGGWRLFFNPLSLDINYKKLSNLFLTFTRYPSGDLPVKPRYFSVKSSRWSIIFDREGNIYLFDYFITTNIYIIHQSFVLTKYLYKYPEKNDDISQCVRVYTVSSLSRIFSWPINGQSSRMQRPLSKFTPFVHDSNWRWINNEVSQFMKWGGGKTA